MEKAAVTEGGTRWGQCAVLGAVWALVIGLYAWCANSGMLELMGSGAKDSYYNLQVQAFRDGHLNLERQVPPEYGDPPNFKWDGNYGLDDLSYYKGRLYLYFGVTPALVLFWPYAAFTGHYLLHKDAAVIFFSAGFLAGAGLLWAVWRRYFKESGIGTLATGMLAVGLGNFAPAVLGRSDVYEVAVGCGYALTMLALCGIWFALHDTQRRWRWLAAASLAYGLAVAARPSLLLGAVILLVPVIQVWREKRRLWPLLAAACGPILLVGAGLAIYNAQRFDNPLEFGQRYQLPLTVHEQFRWRYLWFNIRVGFLKPAQWSGDFPFLDNIAAPAKPAGYCNLEDAFGILTSIPVVWLALAAPLAWRGREEQRRSRLRLFLGAVAALFWMCALPLIFHDSMCLRYELEYASPLVLLAAVGVFAVERAPAGRPVWRRAARCGWVLLLGYSVVFTLLVSYKVNADGHQNFGSALLIKARLDEAIAQYQKTLQMRPGSEVVHNNLANALLREGRMEDAITHYRQALQIKPDYPEARCNFGNALLQEGKVDEAIVQCQLALQLKATTSGANITLGNAFMDKGRVDDAIVQFRLALQTTPDSAIAQFNLGTALMRKGRVDDAILQFRAALKNKPDDSNARLSLGMALAQQGKIEEAILQFQMALQLKPADPAIQITLAWLLATTADASLRDGGKALELARQADLETDQQNPFVLHALAAACAETGKFSEAVETAQRALRLAQAQTNTVLAKALETELSLYRVGSPYHKQ